MLELSGRVAIVTGSTRGIGRGIAERFAAEGASVVVHGRDQVACDAVAAELASAVGHACDIAAPGSADRLVAAAVERFGRLDVVVNNAGVAIDNFITGVTDGRWDVTLATNLTGPFAVLRAATRVMKDGGGGAVLNVISWAGERGNVGQVAYSASKAGLHAVTLSAAKELGKFAIRVNSLSPAVQTDMTEVMDERLQKASGVTASVEVDGHGRRRRRGGIVPVQRPSAIHHRRHAPRRRRLAPQLMDTTDETTDETTAHDDGHDMHGQVWVFDLDGTLIGSIRSDRLRPGAAALLSTLRARGATCVLWSAGGVEYATRQAGAHAIDHHFAAVYAKLDRGLDGRYRVDHFEPAHRPTVFVDDVPDDLPIDAEVAVVGQFFGGNAGDRQLDRLLASP